MYINIPIKIVNRKMGTCGPPFSSPDHAMLSGCLYDSDVRLKTSDLPVGWRQTGGNPLHHMAHAAKDDAPGRTHGGTGRTSALPLSLNTHVTFYGKIMIVVKLHGPERTSLHTCLTANTKIRVDEHNTLAVSADGIHRAGPFAGGIRTVVTIDRREVW